MGILEFFHIKKKSFVQKLDNLVTFNEKLINAKDSLIEYKTNRKKEVAEIHLSHKEAEKSLKLSNEQIELVTKKLNKAIEDGNEERAKRLFNHLEALKEGNKIYQKAFDDITKSKNTVDKELASINNKIATVNMNLESLKVVKKAQATTSKFKGVGTDNTSKNVLAEIEDFIEHEKWKVEVEDEVNEIAEQSSIEADLEADEEEDKNDKFEAYKSKILSKTGSKKK